MKNLLCILTAAVLLTGCAGTYFTFDKAREVKVGMTGSQVQQILGTPNTVATRADKDVWVYSYADGFGNARWISFALLDGKVIEVPRIPDSFGGKTATTNSP